MFHFFCLLFPLLLLFWNSLSCFGIIRHFLLLSRVKLDKIGWLRCYLLFSSIRLLALDAAFARYNLFFTFSRFTDHLVMRLPLIISARPGSVIWLPLRTHAAGHASRSIVQLSCAVLVSTSVVVYVTWGRVWVVCGTCWFILVDRILQLAYLVVQFLNFLVFLLISRL